MKQLCLILLGFATYAAISCSRQALSDEEVPVAQNCPVMITKSSSDLVTPDARYYPEFGKWMIEQEDPFELGRYQNTFARAARALGKESSVRSRLSATHYALRISPSTFAQQESLEKDPDLDVSYVPFGYVLANSPVPAIKSVIQADEHPVHECSYGEDGPEIAPTTLYVVWPVGKEIPATLSYEKEYDVFLPKAADLSEAEEEVVNLIRIYGDNIPRGNFDPFFPRIPDGILTIKVYDNLLSSYVPLKNVKIKAVYGSSTQYYTTNSLGKVTLSRMYGDHATCYYLLEQSKFSVRDSTTSAVVQRSLGYVEVGDMSGPHYSDTYYTFNLSEDLPEIIYNAADYLFKEDTTTTVNLVSAPSINIFIKHNLSGLGAYYPNGKYIEILDANSSQRNYVIGTTLHELGHYYQHYNWGYDDSSVAPILIESFASAFGYYLGEEYYLSKGFVKPYSSYHINGQHRQTWEFTYTSLNTFNNYSPIYVDLIDSYSQSSTIYDYPDDVIENVPFGVILRMGREAESLEDVEDILNEEIVPPYTSGNIASQLSDYFYWRSHQ